MLDPNNVIAVAVSKIEKKSKILGIVSTTSKRCTFYFSETNVGGSITSKNTKLSEYSKNYLVKFYQNTISLNDILEKAGAILTHDPKEIVDIDLSELEKDTILNLLA